MNETFELIKSYEKSGKQSTNYHKDKICYIRNLGLF